MVLNSDDPVLLMCPPDFYSIEEPDLQKGAANDFEVEGYKEYSRDPKGFRREACEQHANLQKILQDVGVKTINIDPVDGMPNLVFTADPTLSLVTRGWDLPAKAMTILSHFSNENRQEEVAVNAQHLEKIAPTRAVVRAYHRTEGTGDNLYDAYRDIFWSGYAPNPSRTTASSGRSDVRAHATLSAITGVEVVSLAVKKPFFHVDTSVAFLSKGHVVCYEDGLQPEAYKSLMSNALDRFNLPQDEYLIRVSKEDAYRYACNLLCFDDVIVMPSCSDELQDKFRQAGYEVLTSDISRFISAGGAMHCLTNNVNQRRIVGGLAKHNGHSRVLDKAHG